MYELKNVVMTFDVIERCVDFKAVWMPFFDWRFIFERKWDNNT